MLGSAIVLAGTIGCNQVAGLDALGFEAGPATVASAGTGANGGASSAGGGGQGAAGGAGAGGMAVGGGGAGGGSTAYYDAVMADSPLAYWRLGEASGLAAVDATGNGYDGLYVGGAGLGAMGAIVGDVDTAVSFDGIDDRVTMGDVLDFVSGAPFSVEAWARPVALPMGTSEFAICGKRGNDANGTQGYILRVRNDGAVEIRIYQNNVEASANGTTALPLGSYTHVVGTYDGAMLAVYANGLPLDQQVSPLSVVDHGIGFGIGSDFGNDSMQGDIDEVAVYDHVLSSARVAAHYAAGQ